MSMVSKPLGIAIHRKLNQQGICRILVADHRNSRLLIVRMPPLQSITPWQHSLCGVFSHPSDVATHYSSGNIFVADTDSHLIRKFTPSNLAYPFWTCLVWGGFGSGKGQFNRPVAIAIDQFSSDVYVSDKGNNRIQKFNGKGEFLLEYNNIASTGIAVDLDRNVYVSVAGLNKVYKFTHNLELIPEWDPEGTSYVQFRHPHGVAIDRKNDVYVVDSGNFEVKKFSKEGVFQLSWGGLGSGDGKFRLPYGITYDANDQGILVSDSSLHRIQAFNEDGSYFSKIIL